MVLPMDRAQMVLPIVQAHMVLPMDRAQIVIPIVLTMVLLIVQAQLDRAHIGFYILQLANLLIINL
jgi:hypothetical protein